MTDPLILCWCCREPLTTVKREYLGRGPEYTICASCDVQVETDGTRPRGENCIGQAVATMALARATDRNTRAIERAMEFQDKLAQIQMRLDGTH